MYLGVVGRYTTKASRWQKFFERVCNEAREIAQRSVKGKLDRSQDGDRYSDCEIADRAGIKSDESDADIPKTIDLDHDPETCGDRDSKYGNSKGKGKRSETDFHPSGLEVDNTQEFEELDNENHSAHRRIFRRDY